jgi:ketosteroid isomerase-like protein
MSTPAARFRAAVEAGDVAAAVALFAEDAVFHSPVAHRPYHGREALGAVLGAVFTVFEDFRYTAEYSGGDGHVLRFATRVGDRALEGVDILEERDGEIAALTVLVRPYSAATALRDRMAAVLAGG